MSLVRISAALLRMAIWNSCQTQLSSKPRQIFALHYRRAGQSDLRLCQLWLSWWVLTCLYFHSILILRNVEMQEYTAISQQLFSTLNPAFKFKALPVTSTYVMERVLETTKGVWILFHANLFTLRMSHINPLLSFPVKYIYIFRNVSTIASTYLHVWRRSLKARSDLRELQG